MDDFAGKKTKHPHHHTGGLIMKLEKVTLSEQIYQQLRKDIINQTLPAGEKITVKMIQEHFSTSYTPAREAIRRLAQEGL